MDRTELLQNIIESSELNELRALIKNSKTLQQKVFNGWRPQALTKEVIKQKVLRTTSVNDDGIFKILCDWWKSIHAELIDEFSKGIKNNWESMISRWPVSKVRLAIVLGEFGDKDTLNSELMVAAFEEFIKVQNQTAATSDAVRQPSAKDYSKIHSKVNILEKRFSEAERKNKTLSKQNTSLSGVIKKLRSELAVERKKLESIAKSNKELTEKIRLLEKKERDLGRQIKLLKKGASKRVNELNVVLVDYHNLGNNPSDRKSSLSLLNDLLCSTEGMVIEIENRPSEWLEAKNIRMFWKKEGNKVTVLNCPEDHIILNMGMMMEDFLYDQGCQNGRFR